MLARHVNQHVRLDLTAVVTERTIPTLAGVGIVRVRTLRMRGCPVLMEAALLEKALAAVGAGVRQFSGVLFHMVEHRVLTGLRDSTVGAHELPLLVPDIDSLRLDHS